MTGNPFILEEADIAVTLATDDAIKVWIGGCARDLTLTKEFDELEIETPGRPEKSVKHVNEKHSIEIENVWLLNPDLTSGGGGGGGPPIDPVTAGLMPQIVRGQVLNMVIVWQDELTGWYNKRTYYNVTGRAQKVGPAAFQNLSYRAERMIEVPGFKNADLTPTEVSEVVYINGGDRRSLYRYSVAGAFEPVSPDVVPALGEIKESASKLEVFIGGTLALKADATGLLVKELIAAGGTVLSDSPRLEFRLDNRVASLSQTGRLVVGNCTEQTDLSGLSGFIFKNNATTRYAVIGAAGAYASEMRETL